MASVYVESSFHPFYKELTEKSGARAALFKTMKDAFMFNFAIGVRNRSRKPLINKTEIFKSDYFDVQRDVAMMNGIYLAFDPNLMALATDHDAGDRISDTVLGAAMEYANAGGAITRHAFNSSQPEMSLSVLVLSLSATG